MLLPLVALTASCELVSGLSDLEKDESFNPDAAAAETSVPVDTGTTPPADTTVDDTGTTPPGDTSTPPMDTAVGDTKKPDAPADTGGCGEPMSITFGGHCYFPLTTNRSWADSKTACEAKGAYLAIIKSSAENDAVKAIDPTVDRWIGLSRTVDPITKENYKWVDGTTFSTAEFDGWDPAAVPPEPNDGNAARLKPNGLWADRIGDTGMFHCICEK